MRTTTLILVVLLSVPAWAKLPPCPGGRYLIAGEPLTGLDQSAPMDVVHVDGRMISIESGCGLVKARVRGSVGGTKVRARWRSCAGLLGKVRLVGVIVEQCRTLSATFIAKADGLVKPVLGSLSACGDGIWDPDGGEECDAGSGPCGSACNACTCGGVTTTTIVTGTTTTTPGATTTSTTGGGGGTSTTTSTTSAVPTTTGGGGSTTSSSTMPFITTTSTTTTTTPTGPDLVPIGWMSPPAAVAGGNLAIQFTVKNNGPGAAIAPWYDYVLFSNDLALGNDTAIGTPQHTMNLAAAGQYVSSPQVTIPAVAPGNYYLFLHTDGSNVVAENNEPNNLGAFVLVQVIAPDLIPTAFTAPASGMAGSSISVSWTVKNQGSSVAFIPWSDRVVFSTNNVFDGGDTTIGTFAHGTNLAVNGTYSDTQSVTLPSVTPGTYYLFLQTDSADQVVEGGGGLESNNVRGPVTINVT